MTPEEAENHIPKYCPKCGTHKGWFILNHFKDVKGNCYLKYRCTNCNFFDHFQTTGYDEWKDKK
jgi:hypothetical protein